MLVSPISPFSMQEMQTVLREPLCIRISGGRLDFPRHASFAAIKIVTWWEADFVAAFKRASGLSSAGNGNASSVDSEDGVIKRIQPSDFILLVVDTAEQLLGTLRPGDQRLSCSIQQNYWNLITYKHARARKN